VGGAPGDDLDTGSSSTVHPAADQVKGLPVLEGIELWTKGEGRTGRDLSGPVRASQSLRPFQAIRPAGPRTWLAWTDLSRPPRVAFAARRAARRPPSL